MIRHELYIEKYDWLLHCYFAVDCYYANEIIDSLIDIDCKGDYLFRAAKNLECGNIDNGLTYSNMRIGESVMVVGLTTSASEFLNSLSHELHHVVCHICSAKGIDIESEEAAYLIGDIAQMLFKPISTLLCDRCRN